MKLIYIKIRNFYSTNPWGIHTSACTRTWTRITVHNIQKFWGTNEKKYTKSKFFKKGKKVKEFYSRKSTNYQ